MTVSETWEMRCPECQRDDRIDITAMIDIRLTPDGSSIDEAEDGDHYWDDNHLAQCRACGHSATVGTFAVRATP